MFKNIEASFSVEVKELNSTLISLSKLSGRFTKTTLVQIRVLRSGIEITSKGITKKINYHTNKEADISLPGALLKGYLKGTSDLYKNFVFRNGELGCGLSIYSSSAIIVNPVFTNRENVLPNNLSKISILKYWLSNNEKENERLGLTATIEVAKHHLKTDINETLLLLKQYNIMYDDVEDLIKKKLSDLA